MLPLSFKVIISLVGYWEAMWPLPRHLKHLIFNSFLLGLGEERVESNFLKT